MKVKVRKPQACKNVLDSERHMKVETVELSTPAYPVKIPQTCTLVNYAHPVPSNYRRNKQKECGEGNSGNM